jgi:uncharacterized tellurite resistance protein B-like protein
LKKLFCAKCQREIFKLVKKDQEIKGREYETTKMILRKNFILKSELLNKVYKMLEEFIQAKFSHLRLSIYLN